MARDAYKNFVGCVIGWPVVAIAHRTIAPEARDSHWRSTHNVKASVERVGRQHLATNYMYGGSEWSDYTQPTRTLG
jgi:hypothetical protein